MRLSSKSSPSHPSCQVRRLRHRHSLKFKHNLKSRNIPGKNLPPPPPYPLLYRNHSSSNSLSSLKFSKHKPPTSPNNFNNITLPNRQAPATLSTLAMQVVPYPSNQANNTLPL